MVVWLGGVDFWWWLFFNWIFVSNETSQSSGTGVFTAASEKGEERDWLRAA